MNKSQKIGLSLAGAALVAAGGVLLLRPAAEPTSTSLPSVGPNDREQRMKTILDNDKTFPERIKAVRELPLEVEDEDLKKLLAYLEAPLPETNRGAALVSLNEVMEQLRLKGRATEEYGKALARILLSPTSDEVVRDYAVQHAVRWMIDSDHLAGKPGSKGATLADRELLLSSIAGLLHEQSVAQGSAWGTTLNALRDLKAHSSQPGDITQLLEENGELIRSVARGEHDAHVGNRVAAIQTLPELADRNASLGLVRNLLQDQRLEKSHKLPLIAALGSMGNAQDLAVLEQLEQTDNRLRYAAKAATDRLKANLDATTH